MSGQPAQARIRTISARIYGRVQGVGFRWNCQHEAERLALVGEVRNRADGSVCVIAQGSADEVARLIVWLYKGPKWASVEDVLVEDLPAGSYMGESFSIRG